MDTTTPNRKAAKATSKRKVDANRRNARRSAGPKDTSKTRYNARKHGLLSPAVLIDGGDLEENPRELEALFARLWDDRAPVGAMEEELVDIIATCCWRRRRAVRAEVGAIRRAADSTVHEMIDARERRFLMSLNDEGLPGGGGMDGSWRDMLKTSLGVQHLRDVLRDARYWVDGLGYLPEDEFMKVASIFGRREGSLGSMLAIHSTFAAA